MFLRHCSFLWLDIPFKKNKNVNKIQKEQHSPYNYRYIHLYWSLEAKSDFKSKQITRTNFGKRIGKLFDVVRTLLICSHCPTNKVGFETWQHLQAELVVYEKGFLLKDCAQDVSMGGKGQFRSKVKRGISNNLRGRNARAGMCRLWRMASSWANSSLGLLWNMSRHFHAQYVSREGWCVHYRVLKCAYLG